jgi:alpha-amylase
MKCITIRAIWMAVLSATMITWLFTGCMLNHKEKEKPSAAAATRHPDWIKQSNVYEVNIRQYTPEGTFKAFAASLPRLKQMGVHILWLMPIHPISKTDRKGTLGSYYAVADYNAINPEFGTLADFKQLVKQAHDSGFKVIIDWVPNHTGADHPWLTRHPDFYNRDSTGKAMYAFDWSDTRDLDYNNKALRDSMTSAMEYWLKETDIDGFRCDVAGEVPADFWKPCIDRLRSIKSIFMLAEADQGALHKAGFDATYPWDMFQTMKKVAAGERNALSIDSVLMRQDSSFPANTARLYFTSNHDENSWNKSDFGTFPGLKHGAFAVLTQTMRGSLPLIYGGQEEPVLRAIPFFEKDTVGFAQYKRAAFYKTLLNLRKKNAALAVDAPFKKVSVGDDQSLYAYIRRKGNQKIAVILNLSAAAQTITIKDADLVGEPYNIFLSVKEPLTLNHSFNIEPWGYIVYEY